MKTIRLILPLLLLLAASAGAACTDGTPQPLPTVAVLPSETLAPATVAPTAVATSAAVVPTIPPTEPPTQPPTERPTDEPSVPATEPPTATIPPTDTSAPSPTSSPTHSATPTRTATPTGSLVPTFTPSLTITNTITPTPSPSFTPSPELGLLGELVALSRRATILPPEQLYNPPTLTALYLAGQALPATLGAATSAALLPTQGVAPVCPLPPPAAVANALAADPGFAALMGCPMVGAAFPGVVAAQAFERGSMIYVQGPPNVIYVLTLDGRFRRYDDTWTADIDPESGGEVPPLGLIEPKRGFGKIWRTFPDVRSLLGWAINEEAGATSSTLPFERGRAINVPLRGEFILLAEDPGGLTGSWRSVAGAF
ncbi:MAG: hypothetical protein IPK19_23425 [Chloroflexi bacterium]|nr:hypothetical protein [Chloroflexota bacterium]